MYLTNTLTANKNTAYKKHMLSMMSIFLLSSITPLQAGAATTQTETDIQTIKNSLANRKPPIKAKSVTPSPITGLYEVFSNGSIFYVDKTANHVIIGGSIIDDVNRKNLTTERLKALTSIKFDALPLKNAIEIKKGSGAYKFAVFTDPDCPYCKSMEQGLEKMQISDYTAYVFLFPLKELHPDAPQKAESIWCAKDKISAWSNWMVKEIAPEKANCSNPLAANEKLADELGVVGTPTIYLQNGEMTQSPQDLVDAMKTK